MANLTRAERLKKYGLNNDGSVNEELQKQNADVLTRVGETFVDVGGNLAKAIGRGVEGLIEGVVGVAGGVGSIFGADTQWAEDIIAQTWTEDVFSGLPEATKNSYINELSEGGQETVRGIIDGVGQAASAIGLSFVNPAAAVAYMGTSAAGRSTEEALYDGANYTDALAYGTTQGVLESALEYVTGGVSKLAKIGGKQAIKSTGKLIAGEALQEAAQEGIQGAINPITKQIYKGSEALDEYKQEGFWQDVGKQALIGGISGSMGAGMGVGIQTAAAGGRKQFKVANASAQVQEALNETAERYAKGKMSDTQLASAVDDISAMNDRLEGFVSKLSFEQQQKMFQPNGEKPAKYRVPQGFEWTDNGLVRMSKATEENFNDIIKQGRASVSLLGREKEVSRLLERTGATIYRGELTSGENANYNKVRKFHQALASKGIIRSNLILVDTMAKAEAFNSGDIIALGKDQLSNEAGVKKILHEVTHFAEGTKEYKKFANFVLSLDGIKDINERILNTSGYGVTQDVIDSAIKKFKAGKELTKAEKTYISEAVAFSAEALLSDEATIERLCQTDRNLAQKILRKIKEFIKVISGRFNGDEQLLKDLRKAEKLYVKALAKSGTEYLVKQQKVAGNKVEGEVDSDKQTAYNELQPQFAAKRKRYAEKKFYFQYNNFPDQRETGGSEANRLAIWWATKADTETGDQVLISMNGNWYLVGRYDDATNNYRVEDVISENEYKFILKGIQEHGKVGKIKSILESSDGYDSYDKRTNSVGREKSSIDSFETEYGRESEKVVQVDSIEDERGEVNGYRSGSSQSSSSNRQGIVVKNSLKDSVGNALTQEQAEFFKDSKVRDENGNLLVVYHGSQRAGFTEFNTGLEGSYFTANKDYAEEYARGKKENVYSVYLNITKPFDTRNTKERRIFEKEFYQQWGNGAPLTERGLLDWTDGADMFDFIQEKGYDYDGIIIDEGAVYTPTGDIRDRGISYVAFKPNQIKNVDNKKPTSSSDIRYALKVGGETVEGALEETKELVALHNLSEDKLLRVIELGGFPMPSIAVTKANLPHDSYGLITVVFDKKTIDPEADSRNVVYDRDAWTPTTPQVNIKLNEDAVDEIIKEIREATAEHKDYRSDIFSFFDGKYRNNAGEYVVPEYDYSKEYIGKKAFDKAGIVAAYLKAINKDADIEPEFREKGFTKGWSSYTRAETAEMLSAVGITKDITRDNITDEQREEVLKKYIQYSAQKRYDRLKSTHPDFELEDAIAIVEKNANGGDVSQLLFMAEEFFDEQRPKDVYDASATLDKLQKQVKDKDDFADWFWTKFDAAFEKRGIDNNSDVFDRRGNRRSFEQRHFTYSVNNIVKAMLQGEQEGKASIITAGSLAAKLSKQFKSIQDIRDAKEYLSLVSDEDLSAFKDRTYELYNEVVTLIAGSSSSDYWSYASRRDDVGEILASCASVKPLTLENIKNRFRRETKGFEELYNFNNEIAEMVLSLFETMKHVPTSYFEAKPRRAVGLKEIKSVLIPEKSSDTLIKKLKQKKIPYQFYNGKDGERSKIIQGMDDIRFSLKDSAGNSLSPEQVEFFKDSKVRDENGNLLVVYHATFENFSVFDIKKTNPNGNLGEGHYFTTSLEDAENNYAKANKGNRENWNDTDLKIESMAYDLFAEKGYSYEDSLTNDSDILAVLDECYATAEEYYSDKNAKLMSVYLNVKNPLYIKRGRDVGSILDVVAVDKDGKIVDIDSSEARKRGYDGFIDYTVADIFNNIKKGTIHVVVFDSNQIKLTTNKNPTGSADIRYSFKEDTRFKANHTQSKVYSREDTAKILNSIMESDYMGFDDSYADIKGHKYKVAEMLYRKMNSEKTEEREKVAYEIADYLIDNAAMQNIYVMDEQQEAMAVLEVLRPYLHNLNLDSIKSEIKYKYDDKSAAVHLLWGKKEGGLRVDAIPQELEEIGFNVKAENQADIFFEIVDMYKSARNILNEKAKKLKNTLSTSELNETRDAIAKDILEAYDRYGRDSSLTKNENLIRKYKQKLAELKEKFRQYADRNHYETLILDACKKLKDKKNHRYKETSILADSVVTQFADVMGGIVARNQIRIDQMRERVLTLDEWYTEERLGMDFNWEVRFALEHLKATKKDANWTPTIEDYQAVNYVVRHVLKLCQTYEQITVKGQKMLVEDLATKGVEIIASGRNYRTGQGAGRKRFFDAINNHYLRQIIEPKVVFEQMESYNNDGVLMTLFDELATAETKQKYLNIQLTQEMDDFFKKNKKFGKELKSLVKFKGEDITVDQALQLFLTAKRAEAKDSIFGEGGISFELNGRKQEIREIQPSDITELYNSFSDKAKEFIDIAHRLFNERCRNAKVEADMAMLGFTNVGDSNDYIPIRREKFDFAKATSDARAYMQDLVSVYNFSFNKQITKNKHVIYMEGLSTVMQRHAHQVSVYAEMSVPLKTFDKVYTRQLEGGKSVQKAANKVWGDFDKYIKNFLCDMQGNFRQESSRLLNWFRNAYVKFQLGFNIKSILSQTAAFPMAYVYLDADVMAKGATMKLDAEALDKYSQYAYVRDYEKAIISANSMMDKVKGFGEISMKPMQKTDRAVIGRIWNACQLQVEKDSGLKVGTEENYVEAAKLLERVGRETQANYSAAERSAWMRHRSDLMRSMTMFTSDAMKQLSRVVESTGKLICFKEKIKSGNYTQQELQEYNEAKTQLKKTVGAVAASTTWYVLISMAMKWLFAKKDEEGEELNYLQEFGEGYVDSFFGLFPLVRDVYGSISDGYDVNNYAFDSVNTLADSVKSVLALGNKAVSSQPITTQEAMRTLRDVFYSLGQVTGIPTRNLYNQASGLISRFSPATGYKITSLFYAPYKQDLTKAIENGHMSTADAIMSRLLTDTAVNNTTSEQRTLYADLIKQGYDPLPKKIGDTITHGEETVELTATQRREFVKIYSQATDKITAMMKSAAFNSLTAEEKAKAIKQIYDLYYGQGVASLFDTYEGGKVELASASLSADKLAVYMAKIRSFESTLDKNGKPISGSKKQKVQNYVNSLKLSAAQKYMLMGLAGYKNKYGEQVVKSHINALKLSKTEKEKLLAYSGY